MGNKNQIFVGGMGGSGTRVVQMILEKGGYFLGDNVNEAFDYMPALESIMRIFEDKDTPDRRMLLKDSILARFKGKEPWSCKHGQQMYIMDIIREVFPGSKFILVVRNGVDNMLNSFETAERFAHKYGIEEDNVFIKRMKFWNAVHKKALEDGKAWGDNFMVVKLEDLCFEKEITIKKLLEFAGVNSSNVDDYKRLVVTPMSIQRRNHWFPVNAGEELLTYYHPEMQISMREAAKEMMDYFGY